MLMNSLRWARYAVAWFFVLALMACNRPVATVTSALSPTATLAAIPTAPAPSSTPQVVLPTAGPGTENTPCPDALPTRLGINGYAYVNLDPPLPNNLRSDAGQDSPLVGGIRPGQPVQILEGPKCADGSVWWRVRDLETEMEGWTAEGDRQNYWLVPCLSRNECGV